MHSGELDQSCPLFWPQYLDGSVDQIKDLDGATSALDDNEDKLINITVQEFCEILILVVSAQRQKTINNVD